MTSTTKNVDKLRSLPEDVLSHILSLMPTKIAVRTSVLSKSWRFSWTLVNILDINDSYPILDEDCFLKFMDRVFELCKTTQVKIFRLHFSLSWVPESLVSKWISEAIDLRIRRSKLPISLLTCQSLTKLMLHDSCMSWPFWDFPSSVNLPNLKTLDIVVTSSPSTNIFNVIHGCPLLEHLSLLIRWCYAEEDYYFKIPTLKRLNLSIITSLSFTNKVVLNVPNLEFLHVDGILCSLFVMH